MKFLQYSFCGLILTLTAAAQTAPSTPAAPAPAAQTAPAPANTRPPVLTTLGGDPVKGPEHPLTLEQMKVLSAAMGYDKSIDEELQANISRQRATASFVPADFWDDLDTSFKKIDYSTALLDVYKKYLSTEDAAKLIEFSKTDAGKHFLESVPATSRDVQVAIRREQQQTGIQVQARHKDELEAAMKKYREEQQQKSAPTLGAPNSAAPAGSTAPAPTPAKPSTQTAPTTAPAPATPPASTTPQN